MPSEIVLALPVFDRSNRRETKTAATIRADILQDFFGTVSAEGAFETANHRLCGVCRQVARNVFYSACLHREVTLVLAACPAEQPPSEQSREVDGQAHATADRSCPNRGPRRYSHSRHDTYPSEVTVRFELGDLPSGSWQFGLVNPIPHARLM